MYRRTLVAPLAAALLVFSPTALSQPKDAAKGGPAGGKPPAGMPVRAVAAKTSAAVDEARAIGTLRADEAVTLRPEIPGRIERMPFAEGQQVKKGALLLALDASEIRAQLSSSTAQAQLDAQRLERAEDLFAKKFTSQQALDEARSSHARSLAKQREDEARLAKTQIRAPFSGVVGLRQMSEGAYVAAGTDIARLEKIDALKLDFRVPEIYLPRLRSGQRVSVVVDAYPGATFRGTVYALEPAIDEQTRTVLIRARVANPDGKLRPGLFARVELQLGTRQKAVWVPEEALVPRGKDNFVFRVADGKAELVKVQTGLRRVGEVEIVRGIKAGELVVTEGTQKIGPGAPVSVMGAAPQKPAADTKAGG